MNEAALGQLLVARGLLTPQQLQALHARRVAGDVRPLPEMVCEAGIVHPGEMQRLLMEGTARHQPTHMPDTRSDPGTRGGSDPGSQSRMMRSSARGTGRVREGEVIQLHPELQVKIERLLGEGGMGAVYLVRDPSLGRLAALKLMKPGGSPNRAIRFRREAAVTARLDHPGIPPVYATGTTPGGQDYILMRYVAGKSLAELLAWGKEESGHTAMDEAPDQRTLLDALVKVGEALAYSHYRGIVHRDVKPANIMVGAYGEVLLMDWGLARDLAETSAQDEQVRHELVQALESSTKQHLTQDGAVLGTPGYMSPEQARGEDLDARADVFALGSILTEVLTGEPAVIGGTGFEVIANASTGKIDRPAARDSRVQPELDAIAAKALAFELAQRYSTAEKFALDLKAWLEGRPVSVYRYSLREQVSRFVRGHPAVVAGIACVLLVSALGLFGVSQARRAERDDATARSREDAERDWAALEATEKSPAGVRLGPALAALQSAQRWRMQAPTDHDAARAEFRVAMALGEVSQQAEQWALAEQAFAQAATLGVDDARARAASIKAEELRTGEARKRREAVQELLRRATAGGFSERGGAVQEAVYQLVGYSDATTLSLVIEQLDAVSSELLRAQEAGLLEAAQPDPDEAAAGERPIDGLEEAVRERSKAGLGGRTSAAAATVLKNAEARLLRRVGRASSGHVRTVLQSLALKQKDAIGTGRLVMARLCCEALGRIGRIDLAAAEGALARYLAAETDGDRALPAGMALIRLGAESSQRLLLDAREKFNDEHFRDQVDQAFSQLLGDEGDLALEGETARAYMRRGSTRATRNRYPEAAADFSRAIELEPDMARAWSSRGLARVELDDLNGAIADFTRAIELEPEEAGYWCNRAMARQKANDRENTMRDYDEAIRLSPRDGRIYLNRGFYKHQIDDVEGALADLDRSIELDPRSHISYLNRSQVRAEKKDLEGALRDADKALELAPEDGRLWTARGIIRNQKGDTKGALDDMNRGVELAPREIVCLNNRGNLLFDTGDAKGALQDFEKVAELLPRVEMNWRNVARAHLALGHPREALEAVERAAALDSRVTFTWVLRGEALAGLQQLGPALEAFNRALALNPRSAPALRARIKLRLHLGDTQAAQQDIEALAALEPNDPYVARMRVAAHSISGDLRAALGSLDREVEARPRDPSVWHRRGMVRLDLGDPNGALEDFDRALELGVKDANVLAARAQTLLSLDRDDEARAGYEKARELEPRCVAAWVGLSQIHLKRHEWAQAERTADRAIELEPGQPASWVNRALGRAGQGKNELALADANKGIELAPKELPVAWLCRGQIKLKLRDPSGAATDFDRALELAPGLHEVRLHRADALERLGRKSAAIADLEAYLKAVPEADAKVRKRLEALKQ